MYRNFVAICRCGDADRNKVRQEPISQTYRKKSAEEDMRPGEERNHTGDYEIREMKCAAIECDGGKRMWVKATRWKTSKTDMSARTYFESCWRVDIVGKRTTPGTETGMNERVHRKPLTNDNILSIRPVNVAENHHGLQSGLDVFFFLFAKENHS